MEANTMFICIILLASMNIEKHKQITLTKVLFWKIVFPIYISDMWFELISSIYFMKQPKLATNVQIYKGNISQTNSEIAFEIGLLIDWSF